jgi:hypothetical protein
MGGARIYLVSFSVQFILHMTDSSKYNHTNVVRMAYGRCIQGKSHLEVLGEDGMIILRKWDMSMDRIDLTHDGQNVGT